MKCSLCGFNFDENDAKACCTGCLFSKGCELLKCPNCGFEMTKEPDWIKRLKEKKEKKL